MAEKTQLTNINIDGQVYGLGIATDDIYAELGITKERFVELLSRDFYCPTLSAAPNSSTLTYIDVDGSVNHFQIGQTCRWVENGSYRVAVCMDISDYSSWYIMPTKLSELFDDQGVLLKKEQSLTEEEKLQVKKNIGLDKGLLAYFPTFHVSDNMELLVVAEDTVSANMFDYDSETGNLIFNYV